MSLEQLWGDYLVLGGSMTVPDFARCLRCSQGPDAFEHDLIAQTLNEHLLEHGQRFPIPYQRLAPHPTDQRHHAS